MIDQHLVKSVIHSFVLLGLDEEDMNKMSFAVHKEHLEKPFLDATGTHYEQERDPFLAKDILPDNLRRAEERVKKEKVRVDRYLSTRSEMRSSIAMLQQVHRRQSHRSYLCSMWICYFAKMMAEDDFELRGTVTAYLDFFNRALTTHPHCR